MTAIETLLAGLFDYAGLYPPASLSMLSAANNYLEYSQGKHAWALGRFIVNADRVEELRSIASESFDQFRLSVIATDGMDRAALGQLQESGARIDAVEIKCSGAEDVKRIAALMPMEITMFFEVSMDAAGLEGLKPIADSSGRAKIRMGGVVPDAIPPIPGVVQMLKALAGQRLPFKATAGLHHPVRSRRALTYKEQSLQGIMHGFMNVACTAAFLYFGGDVSEAEVLMNEQDPSAWRVSAETIQWRDRRWSVEQLKEMRSRFLISIGSCSFEEPIHDLESLGWL
ncbi:MAG TPA: hypothetical protein VG322_03515 [Candidatus Acidoferrales bacterium]|nr:hypothetical protein [Candidatus Acidoferrales bacterium]